MGADASHFAALVLDEEAVVDALGAFEDLPVTDAFEGFLCLSDLSGGGVPHREDPVVDLPFEKCVDGGLGGHQSDKFGIFPVHLPQEFESHSLGIGEGDSHVADFDSLGHESTVCFGKRMSGIYVIC